MTVLRSYRPSRRAAMWAVAAIVLAAMYAILLLRAGVLPPPAALLTLALFVTPALAEALLGEWMGGEVAGT